MDPIFNLITRWRVNYQLQQFAQLLLLCCFAVCLVATTRFIVSYANSSYAQDMASLTTYDDNATQGLVNIDGIHADAISIDRQASIDIAEVKEQVKYEATLADLEFVLQQYEMMELQAFNFVIDMPQREQVTTAMLSHLQTMLLEFTRLNPDINANWQLDPNNALKLIVQLHTERKKHWGGAGFII